MADVRRALRELIESEPERFLPGQHLTVAVSGGADSMALAWATYFVAERAGLTVDAVVVDHRLQDGSDQVAQEVCQRLATLGVSATVAQVSVDLSDGVEQGARNARYAALREHAQRRGSNAVLLGHSQDDQAETVLLGLVRGSGAKSLRAMAPISGLWLRPFLGLRRETTRQACLDAGVPVWDDPHNDDPRFLRVRVRQMVMPVLEKELGPGVTEALARTAELLGVDDDFLTASAQAATTASRGDEPETLRVSAVVVQHPALQARVLKAWCEEVTGEGLHASHVRELLRLVTNWHGQGPLDVPGGKVTREGDVLRITRPPSANEAGA